MSKRPVERIKRVNVLIKETLSDIVKKEVKDPRIGLFSLTDVETSKDLKYAKVFVSVIGEDENRKHALDILNQMSRFLRHRLNDEIKLRTIPELTFHLDTSYDYYQKIDSLLKETKE